LIDGLYCIVLCSASQVHYENGAYIIRQFARGDLFYIITKGKVRYIATTAVEIQIGLYVRVTVA